MLKRLALIVVLGLSATSLFSVHAETMLFGHNLTPTPYTLKKGDATAGNYALAYGLTDDWLIGTSPWIWLGYGMAMAETRYRFVNQSGFEVTAEGMVFDSLPGSRYDQSSTFLRLTGARHFNDYYTLHLSTGHQYFWNAAVPYSLNPWPGLQDYIPSVSMLNEIRFLNHYGIFAEVGVIGLNYPVPERHVGLSAFFKNEWLLFQVGMSETRSFSYSYLGIMHWVTHPEVQIQGFWSF